MVERDYAFGVEPGRFVATHGSQQGRGGHAHVDRTSAAIEHVTCVGALTDVRPGRVGHNGTVRLTPRLGPDDATRGLPGPSPSRTMGGAREHEGTLVAKPDDDAAAPLLRDPIIGRVDHLSADVVAELDQAAHQAEPMCPHDTLGQTGDVLSQEGPWT